MSTLLGETPITETPSSSFPEMAAVTQLSPSSSSSLNLGDVKHIPFPVSCSLKRKRPPSIQIPSILQGISTENLGFRDSSRLQDGAFCYSETGIGVYSVKGKKKFMEDTHKIFSCSSGISKKAFFGVYDGHGGRNAAEFVAENLHTNILEMLERSTGNSTKEEAVKAGYLKTDEEFLKKGLGSGACCVTALIEGKEIVVSNLGDCRAVISRSGVAEALTTDHRANRKDEREKVENKGGYVEIHRGAWRVHGVLSVSRSIGDAHLKKWLLAEPETRILNSTPDSEFLVLASDGLWEKVNNQEAVDVVMRICSQKKVGPVGGVWSKSIGNYICSSGSPTLKERNVLLVKQLRPAANILKDSKDENTIPCLKQRKNVLVKKQITIYSPSHRKITDSWNQSDDGFACEHESPSKAQKLSSVKRKNMKMEYPSQENNVKSDTFAGLADPCKELVHLAVSRGSLDDVTVMIIDLNHFRCTS